MTQEQFERFAEKAIDQAHEQASNLENAERMIRVLTRQFNELASFAELHGCEQFVSERRAVVEAACEKHGY